MKKLHKKLNIVALLVVVMLLTVTPVYGQEVQTAGTYTYDEMIGDINELCATYPGIVSVKNIGTSASGRAIPCVILGNSEASECFMVQSSIHAREYLATQMTMYMIEYYASNSQTFSDMLTNSCFYIVPMANPDGVTITQTVNQLWKANGNGVDLNRNFPVGWANLISEVNIPCYMGFKGYAPLSEPESIALASLAAERNYTAYISYHQQGNVIYYDEPGNTPENSIRSTQLAMVVSGQNGYRCESLQVATGKTVQQGGFTDWVQIQFNKPAITVELGSSLPPAGQGQITGIINRNKNTWSAIAAMY